MRKLDQNYVYQLPRQYMTGQQKLWSPQRFIWSLPQQDGRLFSGLKLVVTTILVVAISLLNSRYVTKTPGT